MNPVAASPCDRVFLKREGMATTLILGGGFGGIAAANELRRLLPTEHEIVVVDKSPTFVVGAGKSWVMLSERTPQSVSQRRAALFRDGVRFVEGTVSEIDVSNRSVTTDKTKLLWDYLVVALGADLNVSAVPGLEAAHTFYTLEGAERLRGEIDRFRGGDCLILIPSTPFKCPPAPYEAAMMLHHEFDKRAVSNVRLAIYTVEGSPMATAGPEMGHAIRTELESRGIEFHPQKKTKSVDSSSRRVVFEDGSEAPFTLLIAIPPHEAPKVVRDAGLTNDAGWIPVDPQALYVESAGEDGNVYAIGDVATIRLPGRFKPDVPLALPKAGVLADAQGRIVARRIGARVLGKTPSDVFDGKGHCYLEVGGERAVKAEGAFFALPHPLMQPGVPDEAQFREKVNWVVHSLKPVRRS